MFQLFNQPERKKFNLKPRYWNPEKEAREEREKRIRAELEIKDGKEVYVPNIEGRFTDMYRKRKEARRGYNGRYAVRLFLILIIVFMVVLLVAMRYSDSAFSFFGM